jgi:hypothetical protein
VGSRLLLVAALVLVVGLAATLLVVRPWARSDGALGSEDPQLGGVAPDVLGWLTGEVPADTPVTASDDLRAALDAGDRIDPAAEGALQVVEGDPADGALVLARFATDDGTTLSVVDPDPVRPTTQQVERRQNLAAAVLANPVAGASGRAADRLRTGNVDARLLGLLAGLVTRMDVHVADLPPAPGEPDDGPPARRLLVDEAGGKRLEPGAAATEELVTFLEAQRPPFAPDTVVPTEDGVLVMFDYVSAHDDAVADAAP